MRIDSHHSFSERYPLDYLETILKRNRFDGGIYVGYPFWPAHDFVKGVVVRDEELNERQLDAYQRQPKFRGVAWPHAGGGIPKMLGELERRGIPVEIASGLAFVASISERFPALRIAIDLSGFRVSDDWCRLLEGAAASPNVFCKLSGLPRLGPCAVDCVRHALAVFGHRRLMFGSNWPDLLPEHSWKASLAAFTQAIGAQTIEVREELLGGTAARFYAL